MIWNYLNTKNISFEKLLEKHMKILLDTRILDTGLHTVLAEMVLTVAVFPVATLSPTTITSHLLGSLLPDQTLLLVLAVV